MICHQDYQKKLKSWTGEYWGITIVNEGGGPTIAEQRNKSTQDLHVQVMKNPMVKLVLENFPGSIINEVHLQKPEIKEAITDELINNEEEWDPFEDND